VLTVKGIATRQRIIDGAAAEIRAHGVAATTLDDVIAVTATSKGQLFHYFPGGREELLLAVADYESERVLVDQQPYLGQLDSWAAWRSWRDTLVQRYRRQGVHCPLGTLITELGRHSPAAQAITGRLIERWQSDVQAGITAMQQSGQIAPALDAARTAAAIIAAIQGGVTILMSTGSSQHLEAALDTMLLFLRGEATDAGESQDADQRSSGSTPRVSGSSQNSTMTSAAGKKVTSPATANR
jgi:AcrR family transcriptional regulator